MNFNLWIESLTTPADTFRKERKNADITEGAIHMAIAGVIVGFITGSSVMMGLSSAQNPLFSIAPGLFSALAFIGSVIIAPISNVIGWLLGSVIFYIFAMLLGGKGSYTTQSYLLAIYSAPLGIISSLLALILDVSKILEQNPFIGMFIASLPALYGLYLLTLSLKEAHGFTTGKAVLTWIIPIGILIFVAIIIGIAALTILLGGFTGSNIPNGLGRI